MLKLRSSYHGGEDDHEGESRESYACRRARNRLRDTWPSARAWDSPTTADGRVIEGDDDAGAIAANIVYAPGHALLCAGAGITAGFVMVLTLGQSYDEASKFMHGACSERWIVRPSDIREAVP